MNDQSNLSSCDPTPLVPDWFVGETFTDPKQGRHETVMQRRAHQRHLFDAPWCIVCLPKWSQRMTTIEGENYKCPTCGATFAM